MPNGGAVQAIQKRLDRRKAEVLTPYNQIVPPRGQRIKLKPKVRAAPSPSLLDEILV
jgi:hypothetical protein